MSEIKVNKISPRTPCGTTTLGDSGDTISIPAGVTITNSGTANGFGATGAVNWQTASIKTGTFTPVSGEGYFADTSGSAFNMTLPAGVAGNIVAVVDYTNTFQNNALTVVPNGTDKIGGVNADAVLSTEGQSVTLVYVDATEGWITVNDSSENIVQNPNLVATGGCVSICGNCKIHTFTAPGTFAVSNISTTPANNEVSYLVIAGGAGAGVNPGAYSGGGGAGGYRELKSPVTPYTASPLDGYPNAPNRVSVSLTSYPIAVGGGGAGNSNGCDSTFSTIVAAGGGKGAVICVPAPEKPAFAGGSGGGGNFCTTGAGTGNTPPTTPSQGNNGGTGLNTPPAFGSGGGGGAGAVGCNGTSSKGGNGGAGIATCITGTPVLRAGGGGGFAVNTGINGGTGGPGGGGDGYGPAGPPGTGPNSQGTDNTGGGAGGAAPNTTNTGGSGIVVIRYKFQ
jgi:hypothetical protein